MIQIDKKRFGHFKLGILTNPSQLKERTKRFCEAKQKLQFSGGGECTLPRFLRYEDWIWPVDPHLLHPVLYFIDELSVLDDALLEH